MNCRNHNSLYFIPGLLIGVVLLGVQSWCWAGEKKTSETLEYGRINQNLAKIAYAGEELFKYDVFWSGGIKVGEIYLAINSLNICNDCYEIDSTITTKGGVIDALYHVRDRHVTQVKGPERLPYFCEIWQKEGRRYRAHKLIHYDQVNYLIRKRKEGDPERTYELNGFVHNEFSSFFSSRLMDLNIDKPFLVPTFGDDKRNEVVVQTLKLEKLENTVFGDVQTLKVTPILTFSGLYDKKGDTVIWYTNDECRVPVHIESKIIIGSLTAKLVEYSNPHCQKYNGGPS